MDEFGTDLPHIQDHIQGSGHIDWDICGGNYYLVNFSLVKNLKHVPLKDVLFQCLDELPLRHRF